MKITRYSLWDNIPGTTNYEPWIEHYKPEKAICDSALVIVPGSGYRSDPDLPKQEGERVAKYYCEMGINVFCLRYRVSPDCFPIPILDGRRAIRYVRYYSEKFGINKDKVAAMGYSAGGHLTAWVSNAMADEEKPAFAIPLYGAISRIEFYTGAKANDSLLGEGFCYQDAVDMSCQFMVTPQTPPTMLLLCDDDMVVQPYSSVIYYEALLRHGVKASMHLFPEGGHSLKKAMNEQHTLILDWLSWLGLYNSK